MDINTSLNIQYYYIYIEMGIISRNWNINTKQFV